MNYLETLALYCDIMLAPDVAPICGEGSGLCVRPLIEGIVWLGAME